MTIEELRAMLSVAWSIRTSSKWRPDNPACGQCGVTALVVQDIMGGDILKTTLDGAAHFYNLIDGRRHDLTASQFSSPVPYNDIPSNRDEAMNDTCEEQYAALSAALALRPVSAGV